MAATLLDAGANPDQQDKNRWSSLMWATTNRHKGIAKLLLDRGASPEIKSSTGRTAFDFIAPNSEMSDYLYESGYKIGIGTAGVNDDFYDTGLAEERFQEEMEQNELKRRMMMESAINLEVDLSSLGLDEQPEVRCIRHLPEIYPLIRRNRHQKKGSWKTVKSSFGTNVYLTRCLFSKSMTWTECWMS